MTIIDNKALFHKKCVVYYSVKRLHDMLSTATPAGTCFFCDGDSAEIKCETLALDLFVCSRATAMKDTKLIAKLSEGQMFARDATYHKRCTTDFYNKSQSSTESSDQQKSDKTYDTPNKFYFPNKIGGHGEESRNLFVLNV